MKQKYVVGFLFSPEYDKVVLIRKNRPQWQVGLLNGVGGHIEEGETADDAMSREFAEETGVYLNGWINYFTIENESSLVYFFWYSSFDYERVESMTDEKIEIHNVDNLFSLDVIPNLRWLIPMVLDKYHVNGYATCK